MTPTRLGRIVLAVVVAALVTTTHDGPDLPNAPADHGVCYEDLGCEDGTSWLCHEMGNRICGSDVASVTR